jgi:hypothetical protein
VCSPERLSSNRLIRTLHPSLLQGHILPSRGQRHPRLAPLVAQVVLSPHVIDWGEGLVAPCGFVLHTTRQDQDKTKEPPPLPSTVKCNAFSRPTFSPFPIVSSPEHLSSNRLTRTLHDSLLQGHILPPLGPRHPRPAPLVLQVLVCQCIIDWGRVLLGLGL